MPSVRRRVALPTLFLLISLALITSGCGRRSKDEPTGAEQATQQVATVAQGPVRLVVAVDGDETTQKRINERLAQDPLLTGVTIETVSYPTIFYPDLDKVAADLQAPDAPDILVTTSSVAAYLSLLHGVYPLNEGSSGMHS